jgi:succinyl-CoA synthetase beta subunit
LANDDAQDMLSSLKAFPVLNKVASIDFLTDALLRLSDLAVELTGKITAVDINPIGLQPHSLEALVLDAKIHIQERRST